MASLVSKNYGFMTDCILIQNIWKVQSSKWWQRKIAVKYYTIAHNINKDTKIFKKKSHVSCPISKTNN